MDAAVLLAFHFRQLPHNRRQGPVQIIQGQAANRRRRAWVGDNIISLLVNRFPAGFRPGGIPGHRSRQPEFGLMTAAGLHPEDQVLARFRPLEAGIALFIGPGFGQNLSRSRDHADPAAANLGLAAEIAVGADSRVLLVGEDVNRVRFGRSRRKQPAKRRRGAGQGAEH
jgi:hypothetical protein